MSDTRLIPPEEEEVPSRTLDPRWRVKYASLPDDVTLRPDVIMPKHNVFVVSALVMVLTSLITFYIPFFNGLLAGTLGGYHAGRMKRALGAAVVASLAVPGFLLFAGFMSRQPELNFFSGLHFKGWLVLHILGLFIGAVGGAACRPLITERNLQRYATINSAPLPGSDAARLSSRSDYPIVPPSGPERGV